MKPLTGLLVVDFSQFLAGPSASLRLADLGARVIKIERPIGGDLCRQLYVSNLELDGDSTIFHTINRNKESFAADLKKAEDSEIVREMCAGQTWSFRTFAPASWRGSASTMRRYANTIPESFTGGDRLRKGRSLAGQARPGPAGTSLTGLPWLNGDAGQPPVPFGLAIADLFAGPPGTGHTGVARAPRHHRAGRQGRSEPDGINPGFSV